MTIGIFRSALEAAHDSCASGDCSEQVFVITGAYAGIGVETVKALLHVKAKKVVIGGRNMQLQQDFVAKLKEQEQMGDTRYYDTDQQVDGTHTLDLGDLASVRAFANYVANTYPVVHVLICNAGVMNTPPGLTKDGFEQQMGVNVIGHFLLAKRLAPQTRRQVWLSSYGHCLKGGARLDIDAIRNFSLDDTANYDGFVKYQQSKLGNILLAKEFSKRYQDSLLAVSVHPGSVYTSLYRDTGVLAACKMALGMIVPTLVRGQALSQVLPKTPAMGAATTVTCATTPAADLTPGAYYSNCAERVPDGGAAARHDDDAAALFDYCDEVTRAFQ